MFFRDKSLFRSIDLPRKVHGVKIVKLPVAKYLAALNILAEPSAAILDAAFPDMDPEAIILACKTMKPEDFKAMFFRIFMAAPAALLKIASELLDIPEKRLFESGPDALTVTQLADILIAFWKKNDMSGFFKIGRMLATQVAARQTTENGFSD